MRRLIALGLLVLVVAACGGDGDGGSSGASTTVKTTTVTATTEPVPVPVRVLVLGDSYAVGEGIAVADAWPSQLDRALSQLGYSATFDVVAETGWTSDRVASEFARADLAEAYDLVVVGVGVNDHFNQYGIVQLEEALDSITDRAATLVEDPADIVILSIVDWRATPRGQDYAGTWRDAPVDSYNTALALRAAIGLHKFVDITEVSLRQGDDTSLVADDGLHASGDLYAEWVELMLPVIGERLGAA